MVYLASSLVFFSLLFLHHFFSDGLLTDLTLSSPPWNTFLLSIRQRPYQGLFDLIYSHVSILQSAFLICTLISENQGIEKLRSVSNLKKIQVLHTWIFFFSLSPGFFQVYGINLKKIQVTNWKKPQMYLKKSVLQDLKFF